MRQQHVERGEQHGEWRRPLRARERSQRSHVEVEAELTLLCTATERLPRPIERKVERRRAFDLRAPVLALLGRCHLLTLPFDELDDHHWDRVIEVNLTAVYTTVKHAARHMKRSGGGRIIVTSSIAAQINEVIVGTPYMPAKAGVDHFVRQMAMELGMFGILINCISPGPFMTNIAGGRLKIPADRKAFEEQSLIGRIGDTEDIKGLALYLASPSSSYVTGSQFVIDGGSMNRIK